MNTAQGLQNYLSNKAAAMSQAKAELVSGDVARETIRAECEASDRTGIRRIRIRDFQLISDSGRSFGGFGLGPSSPEILIGTLASCLTHTYLIGAAVLEIPLDSVNVVFEAENNDAAFLGLFTADPPYPFNLRATVRLQSTASRELIATLHDYASLNCPLTRIMREPVPVSISIDPGPI